MGKLGNAESPVQGSITHTTDDNKEEQEGVAKEEDIDVLNHFFRIKRACIFYMHADPNKYQKLIMPWKILQC